MKQLEIEKAFVEDYLTCGQTYDNFIFENCPIDFVCEAQKLLSMPANGIKPCNVKITKDDVTKLEKTLENCVTNLQKSFLARDIITALVMREVVKDIPEKGMHYSILKEQIKAFYQNDFWKVKQFHATSFFPNDVADYSKKFGKIEVNFFLVDNESVVLQQAINNFISSRAPYSVKVFATNERLASYYDQAGNIIQSPHDYMTRDVNKFITIIDECTQ